MKYREYFYFIIILILISLCIFFFASELLSLRIKIIELEQSKYFLPQNSATMNKERAGYQSNFNPPRGGKPLHNLQNNTASNPGLEICIEGLECINGERYGLFKVAIPSNTTADLKLGIKELSNRPHSRDNIDWLLAGRDKNMFEWDAYSNKITFTGRPYVSGQSNQYIVAIGACDMNSYECAEAVLCIIITDS